GGVFRFVPGSPMWLDEALTVNIAAGPLGDISSRLRHDGHPPLYYWLLHGWMEVFGDSAAAARALSGVLGLAGLVLIYLVARRYGTPPSPGPVDSGALARCALVVFAVSPFAVRYSS